MKKTIIIPIIVMLLSIQTVLGISSLNLNMTFDNNINNNVSDSKIGYYYSGYFGYHYSLMNTSQNLFFTKIFNFNGVDTNITYDSDGANFDELTSKINITPITTTFQEINNTHSIFISFKPDKVLYGTAGTLFQFYIDGTHRGKLAFDSSGALGLSMRLNNTWEVNNYTSSPLVVGQDYDVLINFLDNDTEIYINGVLNFTTGTSFTFKDMNGITQAYVGINQHLNNFYYNGSIDKFILINKTLTAEEVINISNEGNFTTGKFNQSISLKSNDTVLKINNSDIIRDNSTAVSVWFNPVGNNNNKTYIFHHFTGSGNRIYLYMNDTNATHTVPYFAVGSDNELTTSFPVTKGQWHNMILSINASDYFVMVDGNITNRSAYTGITSHPSIITLGTSGELTSNFNYNGLLDELLVYDSYITEAEASNYYLSTYAYVRSNISSYSKTNVSFDVLVNSSFSEAVSCTVLTNSTNATCTIDSDVQPSELGTVITCTPVASREEQILFTPQCNTSIRELNGSTQAIWVDNVAPTITVNFPAVNGTTNVSNNTDFTFDISAADNNLFGFELNCSINGSPTDVGAVQTFGYTEENIDSPTYQFTNTTTITNIGLQQCVVNISDDHTNNKFKVDTGINKLFKLITGKITGNIGPLDFEVHKPKGVGLFQHFDTFIIEKEDRVVLNIQFHNPGMVERVVPVVINCPYKAYKRNTNPAYKEHWVCADGIGGFWIDGNTVEDTVIVNSTYNPSTGDITYNYLTNLDSITMESIGGLNFNSTSFNFTVNNFQRINITSFNGWNFSVLNVFTINYTNSSGTEFTSNTTTGNVTLNLAEDNYTLEYINDQYTFDDLNTTFIFGVSPNDYNVSVWQTNASVSVIQADNGSGIPNSVLVVGDGVYTNTTTLSSGLLTYRLNNGTNFSTNATAGIGYTTNQTFLNVTNEQQVTHTVSLAGLLNLTVRVLDQELGTLITTNATVNMYNNDLNNVEIIENTTGFFRFENITAGSYRITLTSDDYNTRIVTESITNLTAENNVTMYTINSSDTDNKDVVLRVTNEYSKGISGATIEVYEQSPTTGIFNLLEDRVTNIDGETVVTLLVDTVFYRFVVYDDSGNLCVETEPGMEFTISSVTDLIEFDCILGSNFVGIRDAYNNVNVTLIAVNDTNTTGHFTLTGAGTAGTDYCLEVYQTLRTQSLINQTCTNTTNPSITVTFEITDFTEDTSFTGVATYLPVGMDIYQVAGSETLRYEFGSQPDFGNMGLFITLIAVAVVGGLLISLGYAKIGILAGAFVVFLSSIFGIIDISPYGRGIYGAISFVIIAVIIIFIVSKRTTE